jgi:hypothetical protein
MVLLSRHCRALCLDDAFEHLWGASSGRRVLVNVYEAMTMSGVCRGLVVLFTHRSTL